MLLTISKNFNYYSCLLLSYFRPSCRWTLSCVHTLGMIDNWHVSRGMILRHCLPLANLTLQLTLPGTYLLNDYKMLYNINLINFSLHVDKCATHNSLDNQRIR